MIPSQIYYIGDSLPVPEPVIAPGQDYSVRVGESLANLSVVVRPDRIFGLQQNFGIGGHQSEQVYDLKPPVSPAASESNAPANSGIIAFFIGLGRVEHDEQNTSRRRTHSASQEVAIAAIFGEQRGAGWVHRHSVSNRSAKVSPSIANLHAIGKREADMGRRYQP